MIHFLLVAIKSLLDAEFEHVLFPDPQNPDNRIVPHVFVGDLPPKRSQAAQGEDFPFVVIRAGAARDDVSGGLDVSTVKVNLICGVWAKRENGTDICETGVNECQNLVDSCRRFLRASPVLDDKYELRLPLSWQVQEQEGATLPYYLGAVSTTWEIPSLNENQELEGAAYEKG